jgi:hypothetical protein
MNAQVKKGQVIGTAGNTGGTWPMGDGGVHLHFELHAGVVGFEGGRSKSLDPSILSNIALYTGAAETVTGNSGSTGVDNSTGDGKPDGFAVNSAMQQGNVMLSKIQNSSAMTGAMSALQGIYSGDEKKILSSFQKLATNMGMSSEQYAAISNGTLNGSAGAYAPWSPNGPSGNAPQTNNNVNINVTVPDVTAADAMQFATLVKQFLDDNSLLSNAGRL